MASRLRPQRGEKAKGRRGERGSRNGLDRATGSSGRPLCLAPFRPFRPFRLFAFSPHWRQGGLVGLGVLLCGLAFGLGLRLETLQRDDSLLLPPTAHSGMPLASLEGPLSLPAASRARTV